MAGQKNYFGKDSLRPDFLDPKKTLENAESATLNQEPTVSNQEFATSNQDPTNSNQNLTSSLNQLEKNPLESKSLYTGNSLYKGSNSSRSKNRFIKYSSGHHTKSGILKKSSSKKNTLFSSKILRSTPLILVGIIVAFIAVLIIGSSSLLGGHIENLFTEATNTDYTAFNLRSNEIFNEILSGKQEIPDHLKDRLKKEGILVNDDQTMSYNGETITAENYDTTYNNNASFREAITHARRGRVATFFDSAADNFYQKLGLSRDVLHDYQTTGDEKADTAKYDQLMTEYFDVESNSTIETAAAKTSTNSSGEETISTVSLGTVSSNSISSADAKARASSFLDAVGDITESSSTECATLATGEMVATAVASNAKYTYANTFMTIMESISKAMAGESDGSGINTVLNWFTKPETTTIHNPVTGAESQVTGSPLEAQSVRAVLSGVPIDQAKTKDYSLERAFVSTDAALKNLGTNQNTNSSSTTDTGSTTSSDTNTATTFGCKSDSSDNPVLSLSAQGTPGSSFVRTTIGILLDISVGSGFKIVASSTLGLLVPSVADVLYSNAYQDAIGVSGGELFGMGAANVNQLAAQQNSGATGASKEQVLAYNRANNTTIAQEAEIDRKNHSPFDASSPNTFLGSIASSLLPLASTTTSAFSPVSNSSSVFTPLSTLSSISSTSLANLNSTYATGENTTYLTNFGDNCQKAESIGAVSNVYCNMIAVNDLSIIDIPESDPTYQKVISESIEYKDGKEVIREGSPLADFITYWTGRYSMPGIYDANIANACEESRTGNIPILSSILAMLKPVSAYCNSVADGSRYVNSPSNPNWETEKYHQLWVLNNRVKENLGFYQNGDNPLIAFREKYDAEHPLDNSRSGYLARISGLTKYDADTVIALSDYYQELANYHPEDTYKFASSKNPVFNLTTSPNSSSLSSENLISQTFSSAISSIDLDADTTLTRHEEISA